MSGEPSSWERSQSLFEQALDRAPVEWTDFVKQESGSDLQLCKEVLSLLDSYTSGKEELETPPLVRVPEGSRTIAGVPEDAIPGYKIVKELHRGGQGVVYQAIQLSIKRKVALKVMLEGPFAGPASKRRFEREVELVSSLRHPGIVSIFDSGVASGQYFYAMQYVRGECLDEYVNSRGLALNEVLALFVKVCSAIDYAHQKGVIHRDLKPSNVIVNESGEPHVLDFGLAKVGGAEIGGDDELVLVSVTGQVLGTLAYMSPEQAAGHPDDVDMRSDVYSLGVMLYELMTERLPYSLDSSVAKNLETIQTAEPYRPVLRERRINHEVATIVFKALSKAKERRYQTAGGFAEDIRRYLNGLPIEARRDSTFYILKKTLRRHVVPAIVAASLLVMVAGLITAWLWTLNANVKSSNQIAQFARDAEDQARNAAAQALLSTADRAFQERHYQTAAILAVESLDMQESSAGMSRLRSAHANMPASLVWTSPAFHTVTAVASGPEGSLIAAASGIDNWIWVWDVHGRQTPRRLEGHDAPILSLAFHPNGSHVLSGSKDQTVRSWNTATDQEEWKHPIGTAIHSVAISPDGESIAAGGTFQGTVWVLDSATGRELHRFDGRGAELRDLVYSPDGTTLAAGFRDGSIALWDLHAQRRQVNDVPSETTLIGSSPVNALTFLDAEQLLVGTETGRINLWSVKSQRVTRSLDRHNQPVISVSVSPDGTELASSSIDGTIRLWEIDGWRERAHSPLAVDGKISVHHSPDGVHLVASTSDDNLAGIGDQAVRLIDRSNGKATAWTVGHTHYVDQAVFGLDGRLVVTAGADGTIRAWETAGGRMLRRFEGHQGYVRSIDVQKTGSLIASGGDDRRLRVWDFESGTEVCQPLDLGAVVVGVCFHPEGHMLAVSAGDTIQFVHTPRPDATNAKPKLEIVGSSLPVHSAIDRSGESAMCFSPDGRWFACGHVNGDVSIWQFDPIRISAREPVAQFNAHKRSVRAIRISVDGTRLVSASRNEQTVWDITAIPHVTRLTSVSHRAALVAAISPDRRLLVTAGGDRTVRLWNPETGQDLGVIEGHRRRIHSVEFSPDGRSLATASYDEIRLYKFNTPVTQANLFPDKMMQAGIESVFHLSYSRDESLIVARCNDGCRLLDYQTSSVREFPHAEHIAIDPNGRWLAVYSTDSLELIDRETDEESNLAGPFSLLRNLTFNSTGTLLAANEGGRILLWDTRKRQLLDVIPAHNHNIRDLAFSPTDSDVLASCANDQMIHLWNLSQRSHVPARTLQGHADNVYSMAFSADGKQLVSSSTGDVPLILLWDLTSGSIMQQFLGHSLGIDSVVISGDGQRVASGSRDKTVRLWDVHTGDELTRFADHLNEVRCVVFTPDGQQLVSCDLDGAYRIRSLRSAVGKIPITRPEVESVTGLFFDGEAVHPIPKRVAWWTEAR